MRYLLLFQIALKLDNLAKFTLALKAKLGCFLRDSNFQLPAKKHFKKELLVLSKTKMVLVRSGLFLIIFLSLAACRPTYLTQTFIYQANEKKPNKVFRLDLSHQNITTLPLDIEKYTHLKFLNLSNNPHLDFSQIGEGLSKLKKLEVLKLDANELSNLPEGIEHLTHLKNLSLTNNPKLNLENVLEQLQNLPALEKLNLSHNALTNIPKNIKGLTALKNLRLSNNNIVDAKSYVHLSKLNKLKILWLDNNKIEVLPSTLGNLSQLKELYLGNNSIAELPNEIIKCKKLRVLYLGNNQLTELSPIFLKMKLRMLVLYGNQIREIPPVYQKLRNPLTILVLDNNFLNEAEQKKARKYFKGFILLSMQNQR